ncbi:hypothetical protein [uncultured Aquimarina sp.]|uniref:hypothetical protein n=1 Tax=uncultured Aquimarina sp. TaxID=575652 RepID=UPI002604FEC6|nr:hypothetical protein [uncultured Aquimarina sp.]
MTLTFGIIGFLAGIGLLLGGNILIGSFGSIASAGLAYKGYKDLKELKNSEDKNT